MELGKVFDLLSLFSPFLLVSFIALLSVYNQDLKALVLIFGIIILIIILKAMRLKVEESTDYNSFCTLFNVIETPGSSSAVIAFIFMSMFLPMYFNKHYNMMLISVLFIMYFSDAFYRAIKYKCYGKLSMITTLLSSVIGISFGTLYFFAIYLLGEDYYNLLYFNVSKNNRVQCDKLNTREYNCELVDEDGNTIEKNIENIDTLVTSATEAAAEAAAEAAVDRVNALQTTQRDQGYDRFPDDPLSGSK